MSKLVEASSEERSTVAAAFAALAEGGTEAAEDEFEREYEGQDLAEQGLVRKLAEARKKKATARNVALLRNVAKAVTFLSEGPGTRSQ